MNRGFWSLFGTNFFGTFNDNFFRTALITLITYHLTNFTSTYKVLFVSSSFGIYMLPFFLFSPLAGQLSDLIDKSKVIRVVKITEIIIMAVSTFGFMAQDPYFLLIALFFLGVHTTFFNPVRFSILPDMLHRNQLLLANGYMEGGNFFSIMLGTLFGALVIHLEFPMFSVGLLMIFVAMVGFVFSLSVPKIAISSPSFKLRFSWMKEMKLLYSYAHQEKGVIRSIICISWFWLLGGVLLAQLPNLSKEVLNLSEPVFIFLLLLFTIGIGAGSIACNLLFKGEITIKHVPLFSLIIIPLLFDIASFRSAFDTNPLSLASFLSTFQGLELTFDFLVISFVGGLFVVPLYAFIQTHVPASRRSQVIAFNNIINAGFMVVSSFASFCLLAIGLSVPALIFITAVGQVILTIYLTQDR
jgi:acyl-[acyl-carrier-protein]-phospholipid O-acyltransferase/long-chain-fatty-acid--[acyl-carrier-protein] ligase